MSVITTTSLPEVPKNVCCWVLTYDDRRAGKTRTTPTSESLWRKGSDLEQNISVYFLWRGRIGDLLLFLLLLLFRSCRSPAIFG
jgi:hypothetical protein